MIQRTEDPSLFDSIVAERPPQRTQSALQQEAAKDDALAMKRAIAQQELTDCRKAILGVLWREMTPREIAKFSGVGEDRVLELLLEMREEGIVTEQGGRWERARGSA